MRKKSRFPTMAFNRYLSALQQGLIAPSIMQVFLNIESGLNIQNTDYKSIRRSLFQFSTLSTRDKQNLVTRLLHAARANLVAVKRFIDSALSGKSIPSSIVQAYLPAIQLIDDIVKAGPSYVSVLKALQSRAKKSRK